jgi:hypothetical protein
VEEMARVRADTWTAERVAVLINGVLSANRAVG